MKTFIISFSVLLSVFSGNLFSQTAYSLSAKKFMQEFQEASLNKGINEEFAEKHDLIKIDGEYHVGILAMASDVLDEETLSSLRVKSDTRFGELRSFRVPLSSLSTFTQTTGIRFIDISSTAFPDLQLAIPSARVDSVHQGLGGLSQAYFGTGVVIGVIDWGFDYTHPNFYDTTHTYSRIARAWDQNKNSGPAPSGYSFGTEYLGPAQLLAAEHDTLYVFGPISHGTHVAGIAGGTGVGTGYHGAAPDAEFVFVSLKRDAASLVDAFSYISNHAAAVGKPFVVNMSFGSHLGPHDGKTLQNMAIDIIQGPGKVFVASAGNNGNAAFHVDKDFSLSATQDTLMTVVDFGNVADMWGQGVSIWGSPISSFSASIRLVDNGHNIIYQSPFYSTSTSPSIDEVTMFVSDSLHIVLDANDRDFLNDRPQMLVEIKNRTPYKVVLLLTSDDSHVHAWNTIKMGNRNTNWGVAFSATYPGAVAGDINYGIGDPAGCGKTVITVGSYLAEKYTQSGNVVQGTLSSFTSRGPTIDERTKPEISSTGSAVISSLNSFDPSETTGIVTTVDFQGRTYSFKAYSGTSMSGPMVAGIVALMLEAFPSLSAAQAKEVLKTTARLDNNTGAIGPEGTNDWGWGKANALAAVRAVSVLSGTNDIKLTESLFTLYPNPASDVVYLQMNADNLTSETIFLEVYSISGQLVMQKQFNPFSASYAVDVSELKEGVYLLQFQAGGNLFFNKLMVSK